MNTTFTNYAEKKAKQFLNLLQGYTKGIRMTAILILLLMGVNNAWAYEQFNEIWGTYDIGDGNQSAAFSSDKELGNVSKFTIQAFYLKCKDDWGASKTCWYGGALYYKVNNGNFTEVINTATDWKPDGWAEAEYQFKKENMQVTLATNSGKYTVEFYGKVWGNHDTYLNDNGNNYQWTFNILPPDISNFTVTATGHISGSGTSGDPYIIPSGQSLTLNLSGSKAHTDANSSLQYNTSGTWNTTTSKTISNITSTTKTSVKVKMRCYNSTASLSGTESSETIYYKAAATTPDPEETETVYFINTCGWESAYAHCWGGNAAGTTWPGVKMNSTGEKIGDYDVYSYTANKAAYTSVKFNGGSDAYQINMDLQWADGVDKYFISACSGHLQNWYTRQEAENLLSSTDPGGSVMVYYVPQNEWNNVKAYAWNSESDRNKDWPGVDMASTGETYLGKAIYKLKLNKAYANIIFNNGSGAQTSDLKFDASQPMYRDNNGWHTYVYDHKVIFNANGGEGTMEDQKMHYNTATALNPNKFTKNGYTFDGWNTASDGTGFSHNDQEDVTVTDKDLTLYAQWTPVKYTINYKDQNNANFSGSHATGYPNQHTYGTETT